jgi:hypothetical protein
LNRITLSKNPTIHATLKHQAMNKKIFRSISFLIFGSLIGITAIAQDQQVHKINFKDFAISVKQEKVNIHWSTDNTIPANYFEVQKSTDGVNYKTIYLVLGPDPAQSDCDCYGCFDKIVKKESKYCYYRLVHITPDGTEQTSEPKQLALK